MWRTWLVLKHAVLDFVRDDAMTLAAALSFYTALSLSPLIVLLLWVSGLLGNSVQAQLLEQVVQLVGPQAGLALEQVLENAEDRPEIGSIAGWIGLFVLLFSATGVFAQLQASLNLIWDVEPRPGTGVAGWLRKRLLSLGMVLAIGFLLLVSLALNTAVSLLATSSAAEELVWPLLAPVASAIMSALLFGAMFKILPDVRIGWRDVWIGAVITAGLFAAGKAAIGFYLGHQAIGSTYGAAGSLLVLLVWVYYSSLLVFFGAELTQSHARHAGRGIVPGQHAVRRSKKA